MMKIYAQIEQTDQLRRVHHIHIYRLEIQVMNSMYIVTAYGQNRCGRVDASIGCTHIGTKTGEELVEAIRQATDWAKHQVTLALCDEQPPTKADAETLSPRHELDDMRFLSQDDPTHDISISDVAHRGDIREMPNALQASTCQWRSVEELIGPVDELSSLDKPQSPMADEETERLFEAIGECYHHTSRAWAVARQGFLSNLARTYRRPKPITQIAGEVYYCNAMQVVDAYTAKLKDECKTLIQSSSNATNMNATIQYLTQGQCQSLETLDGYPLIEVVSQLRQFDIYAP